MHSFLLLLVVLDFLERNICVEVHILEVSKISFRIPFDIWNKCFPKSISSIPDRSIEFLHLSVVKLQNCVLHDLEDFHLAKRLSVTKVNNPGWCHQPIRCMVSSMVYLDDTIHPMIEAIHLQLNSFVPFIVNFPTFLTSVLDPRLKRITL
ncbi:hypothetical protein GEMRC1_009666 [Eukaryota sp. GEM-RC1]